MYRIPVNPDCRLCVRRNNLERRLLTAKRGKESAVLQEMILSCLQYVDSLHRQCSECGILIGEHHKECVAYNSGGRTICGNCRNRVCAKRGFEKAQRAMVGLFEHWQQTALRTDREGVVTAIKQGRKDWGRRARTKHQQGKGGLVKKSITPG